MNYKYMIAFVTAISVHGAYGVEPPTSQSDLYTILCIEQFSMQGLRDGCSLNFPVLKQPIETAYQEWVTKNKSDLDRIHDACEERLKVFEKKYPSRFERLKEEAAAKRKSFLSKIDDDVLPQFQNRCQDLVNDLNQKTSVFPANILELIRTTGILTESVDKTPLLENEFSVKPGFEVRLVVDACTDDSASFVHRKKTSQGEIREIVCTGNKVVMDHRDFKSISLSRHFDDIGVDLDTTEKGKISLANITRDNVGKRLSFIFDGQVLLVVTIRSEIPMGRTFINTRFEQDGRDIIRRIGSVREPLYAIYGFKIGGPAEELSSTNIGVIPSGDEGDCQKHIIAGEKGFQKSGSAGMATRIKSECASTLSAEYQEAVLGHPILDAYVVKISGNWAPIYTIWRGFTTEDSENRCQMLVEQVQRGLARDQISVSCLPPLKRR